jgi:hypothetical protein
VSGLLVFGGRKCESLRGITVDCAVLIAQFWNGNPLSPGSGLVVAPIDLAQGYSVSVAVAQPVPEPGTLSLAIPSLAVGRLLKRRAHTVRSAESR